MSDWEIDIYFEYVHKELERDRNENEYSSSDWFDVTESDKRKVIDMFEMRQ